ncbi:MAG TPA: hypothetical protein VKS22_00160 [Candidatus Binataceae bacterium]|nr:hypothetical protein [Candidatus Binataceae bacterium]
MTSVRAIATTPAESGNSINDLTAAAPALAEIGSVAPPRSRASALLDARSPSELSPAAAAELNNFSIVCRFVRWRAFEKARKISDV